MRLAGGGALAINGTNSHGTGRNLKRGGKENATEKKKEKKEETLSGN